MNVWFSGSSIKSWQTINGLWNAYNKFYKLTIGNVVFLCQIIFCVMGILCWFLMASFILMCKYCFTKVMIGPFLTDMLELITCAGYCCMEWESTGMMSAAFCLDMNNLLPSDSVLPFFIPNSCLNFWQMLYLCSFRFLALEEIQWRGHSNEKN